MAGDATTTSRGNYNAAVTRVAFASCAIVLAAACSSDAAKSRAWTDPNFTDAAPNDTATPGTDSNGADGDGAVAGPFHVLLFSRTTGFRHDSIPAAIAALTELGAANGYTVEATEDPADVHGRPTWRASASSSS